MGRAGFPFVCGVSILQQVQDERTIRGRPYRSTINSTAHNSP